jgi:hypothetical protein
VSVHYEASRNRYVERWREDGRNRSRQFASREEAEELKESHQHGMPLRKQ